MKMLIEKQFMYDIDVNHTYGINTNTRRVNYIYRPTRKEYKRSTNFELSELKVLPDVIIDIIRDYVIWVPSNIPQQFLAASYNKRGDDILEQFEQAILYGITPVVNPEWAFDIISAKPLRDQDYMRILPAMVIGGEYKMALTPRGSIAIAYLYETPHDKMWEQIISRRKNAVLLYFMLELDLGMMREYANNLLQFLTLKCHNDQLYNNSNITDHIWLEPEKFKIVSDIMIAEIKHIQANDRWIDKKKDIRPFIMSPMRHATDISHHEQKDGAWDFCFLAYGGIFNKPLTKEDYKNKEINLGYLKSIGINVNIAVCYGEWAAKEYKLNPEHTLGYIINRIIPSIDLNKYYHACIENRRKICYKITKVPRIFKREIH